MQAKSNNLNELHPRALIDPGAAGNFITTWKTDNPGPSGSNQITIPTIAGGYNYEIYWEDKDNASINGTIPNITGACTITFPAPGTYRVEIAGSFPRIYLAGGGDKDKILSVDQWGSIQWTSMASAFRGASNLRINATDAPDLSGVTTLENMFQGATAMNDPIGHWDVSNVKGLYAMFYQATSFNQDLNNWDVSNVINMSNVFTGAIKFNGNISNWDVSQVTEMYATFDHAESFNQDLSGWNVGNVNFMNNLFSGASSFNGDISNWNVGNATSMGSMFNGASSFNGDISKWNVSNVTNMSSMFQSATNFNGDITEWDVSNVTGMNFMFWGASSFNRNIAGWDVSNVTNMASMFADATSFNIDINNWVVSNVTNMTSMFSGASNFNENISGWNVSNVNNMASMFSGASNFNGDISNWNVSNVTNMSSMFAKASGFNGDISNWNVSNVTNMSSMFSEAYAFNGDITGWNVSGVTNMSSMFVNAVSFNGDITGWNVSNVTNMHAMFYSADIFNQDLKSWDFAKVTDMSQMLHAASAFNQSLGQWNISSVTNMSTMLSNSGLSTENYEATLIGWASRTDLQHNVMLGADGLRHCRANEARERLISEFGWSISGDIEDQLCNFNITPGADNIVYVNKSVAGGDGTGNSWANAVPELADALHWARLTYMRDGDASGWGAENPLKIYVATGTYLPKYHLETLPDLETERSRTFAPSPYTQVYGGFDPQNNITDLSHQRIIPFITPGNATAGGGTILSGNIGDPAVNTDNAYHVMISFGYAGQQEFLIDGLKITEGKGNSLATSDPDHYNFLNTAGTGLLNVGAMVKMNQVCIADNHAGQEGIEFAENGMGAGIATLEGQLVVTNSVISGNTSITMGAGVASIGSNVALTNVIFSGNSAPNGSAVANYSGSPVLTNLTISGNTGIAFFNKGGYPVIRNSIIWGNSESVFNFEGTEEEGIEVEGEVLIANSIVEGGYAGTNVSDFDPQFVDNPGYASAPFTTGNYTLGPISRAVNAGDPLTNSDGYEVQAGRTDLVGNSRIHGDYIVDLGAYELNCSVQLAADGTSTTQNLSAGPNYLYDACNLFAVVEPKGETSPVSGTIVAQSWTKAGIISYRNARYVRRHYDLAPASGGDDATADITLYYTQADFDAYNAAYGAGNASQLPTGPADQLPGNIRIAQVKGDYTVNAQTVNPETRILYIVPQSVVWNEAYSIWEVKISVNGFSGFFLTGQNDAALPVTLVNFDAKKQEQTVQLDWKTTSETNASHFEVERSSDSKVFATIGKVNANGESAVAVNYQYLDLKAGTSPILYYRLKMVDRDNTFAYSRIEAVHGEGSSTQPIANLYPNPTKGRIEVETTGIDRTTITVYNLIGGEIKVKNQPVSQTKAQLDLQGQPAGIYTVVIRQGGNVTVKKIALQ